VTALARSASDGGPIECRGVLFPLAHRLTTATFLRAGGSGKPSLETHKHAAERRRATAIRHPGKPVGPPSEAELASAVALQAGSALKRSLEIKIRYVLTLT
jgi:hypothetical protein